MATKEIRNLDNGALTGLGGNNAVTIDSMMVLQNSDGSTFRLSLRDFLGFLGFNVGTEGQINTAVASRDDPMMAFITDGRKSNHVEGSGTLTETSGNGTGLLATYVSSTDVEGVDDGSDVVT
jgi:hypothetical protein